MVCVHFRCLVGPSFWGWEYQARIKPFRDLYYRNRDYHSYVYNTTASANMMEKISVFGKIRNIRTVMLPVILPPTDRVDTRDKKLQRTK